MAACGAAIFFVHEPPGATNRVFEGVRAYVAHSWRILEAEPEVRRFLVCNSAWEGTFAGARFFVVLYITKGLGESVAISTAVLATVATGYVIAAAWAGRIGDRFGLARVIYYCSFVYGGGLLLGGLVQHWRDWYLALDVPRHDRRRRRHDPRVGPALQAHARRANGAPSPGSRQRRRASA